MENNVNNESLKLETAKQVTLPYTATRDCFFGWWATTENKNTWYLYLNYNGTNRHYPTNFSGYTERDISGWVPMKKGDTISLNSKNNLLYVDYFIM